MEIIIREEGTPTVVALEGRLDTTTAPQLETFAEELYAKGVKDIAMDMAACDFRKLPVKLIWRLQNG